MPVSVEEAGEADPDFDAAAHYVEMARQAHAAGDRSQCDAARRLVVVALRIDDVAIPKFHLKHLAAR